MLFCSVNEGVSQCIDRLLKSESKIPLIFTIQEIFKVTVLRDLHQSAHVAVLL